MKRKSKSDKKLVLPENLEKYIIKYQQTKDKADFERILLTIDYLIIRMIKQISNCNPYFYTKDSDELYNIAVVVLYHVLDKYRILTDTSIYSFPIYLKSQIFKKLASTYASEFNEYKVIRNYSYYNTGDEDGIVYDSFDKIDSDEIFELINKTDYLTDIHKDVLIYRFKYDMSYREISDKLNIPIGTVSRRLMVAIGLLKEILKKDINYL